MTRWRRADGRGRAVAGSLIGTLGSAALLVGLVALFCTPTDASAAAPVSQPTLVPASDDSVTNLSGTPIQNVTHVETDTASWGSTVVAAFQAGRTTKGYGAAAIGFATSTDDGQTWTHGLLPGLTTSSPSPGTYPLVVNQSVAYDAAHGTWLVPSVGYVAQGSAFHEKALLVSRSTDGLTWGNPVTAVPTNVDKAWGVCDNTPTSPHYGSCYVAYSQLDSGYRFAVVASSDGGATWSAPVTVPDGAGGAATGYNVVPVVQPDGTVVVAATDTGNGGNGSLLLSFTSHDGGATWSAPSPIATVAKHQVAGVRALTKPTVDVDADGLVTAVWADCRFETGCSTNDLVRATSTDGAQWTAPTQLSLQPSSGALDQFDPGVAIAPGTAGASAQLSVVYYTFVPCATTCVDAEYATSYDGGATWSAPYAVGPTPMDLSWLATSPGSKCQLIPPSTTCAMVGDYNSVSFVDGAAVTVVPLAAAAPTAPPTDGFSEEEWALALPPGWPNDPTPTPTTDTPTPTPTSDTPTPMPTSTPTPTPTPPPVAVVPDTFITGHPRARLTGHGRTKRVTFRVASVPGGAGLECRLDSGRWRQCGSVVHYRVKAGRHLFQVRSSASGLIDPTPATFRFRVRFEPHG